MPEEDATSNGAGNGAGAARLRRPALDRTEPRRGWGNLYAPGRADAARAAPAASPPQPAAGNADTAPQSFVGSAPAEAASRVIRDGYRIVEENLKRGRQVAAELRGVRREVADFAGRIPAQKLISDLTQTVIDPALTQQMLSVARTFLGAFAAVVPSAATSVAAAPVASPSSAPRPAEVALHPQERPDYTPAGARVLKLLRTGADEWLADLEIDGKIRRVQVRAVDGEL